MLCCRFIPVKSESIFKSLNTWKIAFLDQFLPALCYLQVLSTGPQKIYRWWGEENVINVSLKKETIRNSKKRFVFLEIILFLVIKVKYTISTGCLFLCILTYIVYRKFLGSLEILVNIFKSYWIWYNWRNFLHPKNIYPPEEMAL